MIWGNNSFSVSDCKNGHKSFHYMYPGLFAELDIKSWHLFPHPMNDLVLHIKWGRSANMAILILGPCNFHCLRTHHRNKLEDEGPPGPDPSQPSHPRCSLRHERPAMISRASHPSPNYLQMPEEPGWTRKRVCLSPHQTVSPHRSDWNKWLLF